MKNVTMYVIVDFDFILLLLADVSRGCSNFTTPRTLNEVPDTVVVSFRFSRESATELANNHRDVIVSVAHIAKFMLLLWKWRVQCRLYFYIFSSLHEIETEWDSFGWEKFISVRLYGEWETHTGGRVDCLGKLSESFHPSVPLLIVGLLSFPGTTRGDSFLLQSNSRRECYLWHCGRNSVCTRAPARRRFTTSVVDEHLSFTRVHACTRAYARPPSARRRENALSVAPDTDQSQRCNRCLVCATTP